MTRLNKQAKKKGLVGKKKDIYVYGAMQKQKKGLVGKKKDIYVYGAMQKQKKGK